jgi:hypothetical protein
MSRSTFLIAPASVPSAIASLTSSSVTLSGRSSRMRRIISVSAVVFSSSQTSGRAIRTT